MYSRVPTSQTCQHAWIWQWTFLLASLRIVSWSSISQVKSIDMDRITLNFWDQLLRSCTLNLIKRPRFFITSLWRFICFYYRPIHAFSLLVVTNFIPCIYLFSEYWIVYSTVFWILVLVSFCPSGKIFSSLPAFEWLPRRVAMWIISGSLLDSAQLSPCGWLLLVRFDCSA